MCTAAAVNNHSRKYEDFIAHLYYLKVDRGKQTPQKGNFPHITL